MWFKNFIDKKVSEHKDMTNEQSRRAELEAKRKMEIAQMCYNRCESYCSWYAKEINGFVTQLKSKGFNASWGIEFAKDNWQKQTYCFKENGIFLKQIDVYDLDNISGIAFDDKACKMVYFIIHCGAYDKFDQKDVHLNFDYVIIPYDKIFSANIDIDSENFFSTTTFKKGGLCGAVVGAVIGGTTGAIIGQNMQKEITTTCSENKIKNVTLNIQTTVTEYPIISFSVNTLLRNTYYSISNVMETVFSGEAKLLNYSKGSLAPIKKQSIFVQESDEEVRFWENRNLKSEENPLALSLFNGVIQSKEDLINCFKDITMKIESIIQSNNNSSGSKISDNANLSLSSELTTLIGMKDKGYLTEEEFSLLKKKIIDKL